MEFCPNNVTFTQIWLDHGFSQCSFSAGTSIIALVYIAVFGCIQLRYLEDEPENYERLRSKWYYVQIALHFVVPLWEIAWTAAKVYILDVESGVRGYMLVTIAATFLSYMLALKVLRKECRHGNTMYSSPGYGHSTILLVFWTLAFIFENLSLMNVQQKSWWNTFNDTKDTVELVLFSVKYISCMLLFLLGFKAPGMNRNGNFSDLNNVNDINSVLNDYERNPSKLGKFLKRIKKLLPFLWPKKSRRLQLHIIICLLIVVLARVTNVFVPLYSKKIIDELSKPAVDFCWQLLLVFIGLKTLQGGGFGGMGIWNNVRAYLWIGVQQYTTREIEIELFRHLHSLSLRWHVNRKSGEVLRVMDRGTDSLNNLLSNIIFSILPTIVDIIVAVIYFFSMFNVYFGAIVLTTMVVYLFITIAITEWRTKFQRAMNLADNEAHAQAVDSLLNFETVKYYNAERFEVDYYRGMVEKYQMNEWKSQVSLSMLNFVQNVVITLGLLLGSLLCIWYVHLDRLTVGDYVLFSTYLLQLYAPLNWFGTYYRVTQRNFVDMENMFDLLKEQEEVIDSPNATQLCVPEGKIQFDNVTFAYNPDRVILKRITFEAQPGTVTAIVGPSGAGKSTIMRLLFRFYDVDYGSISIDEQNIKTVTQESLRQAIGVVPQDTVLFNNTIKYNINYGNWNAHEADVIDAAKNADIHDRILNFPQGYETKVGERGLRLSGGEKQRVAIARTFLKSPQIVLLDEATSALDTETERHIQAALKRVCRNRTTIVVAHRLSTIVHADQIIVLQDGEIVERGKHEELLNVSDGVYAKMWGSQLEKERKLSETLTSEKNQITDSTG